MGFRGIVLPEVMKLAVDADIGLPGRLVKCVLRWSLCHVCGPSKGVVKRVVDPFHAALLRLSRFPQSVERQVLTDRIEKSGRHDLNVRLPAPKAHLK